MQNWFIDHWRILKNEVFWENLGYKKNFIFTKQKKAGMTFIKQKICACTLDQGPASAGRLIAFWMPLSSAASK